MINESICAKGFWVTTPKKGFYLGPPNNDVCFNTCAPSRDHWSSDCPLGAYQLLAIAVLTSPGCPLCSPQALPSGRFNSLFLVQTVNLLWHGPWHFLWMSFFTRRNFKWICSLWQLAGNFIILRESHKEKVSERENLEWLIYKLTPKTRKVSECT